MELIVQHSDTTHWRHKKVLPGGYDDVHALVPLARKARDLEVEFSWFFSEGQLQQLRKAVFHWAQQVQGRYRCFDALVLAAINDCLDDRRTEYSLVIPPNATDLGYSVTCSREADEACCLAGHATFDVVFGYGRVCADKTSETCRRMDEALRSKLANTVGSLGWDVWRLQKKSLKPVLNVLYGLPSDYGIHDLPVVGPPLEIALDFDGPFSLFEEGGSPNLFTSPIAERVGVYIWTIKAGERRLPWYVGQTRRGFAVRTGEHVSRFLSGGHNIYDATQLSEGRRELLWCPHTRHHQWPQTLPAFLAGLDQYQPAVLAMLRLVEVHCAPLNCEASVLDRVEGALGRHFRNLEEEGKSLFSRDIHFPPRMPTDGHLRLRLKTAGIEGLPDVLEE